MRIGPRIGLGFGLVLIALVAVAFIGHSGLRSSDIQVQRFGRLTNQTSAILDIERRMVDLQRRVLAFTYSGYSGIVTRVRGLVIELRRQIEFVTTDVEDPEQRLLLQRMLELFELYASHFEQAVEERQHHDRWTGKELAPLNLRARELLENLQRATRTSHPEISEELASSLVDLLLAHQNALAFENSPDSTLMQSALSHLDKITQDLDEIEKHLREPSKKQQIAALLELTDRYRTAFSGMVQSTRAYLHLIYVVMAGEAAELDRLAETLKERTLLQQSLLRQDMEQDLQLTRTVSLTISALAVLLAGALSWRIARSITKPLITMTETLTQLSEGKIDAEIPYGERTDEIGAMAKAANIFREEVGKKQRAEAANKAKSLFLAHMSHELRTPLNAILGFSELIAHMESTPRQQREYLQIINRSGTHLLNMINDILDMSKIEAGQYEIHSSTFDLWQLLDDVASLFALRTEQAAVTFSLERAPEVPRMIDTDAGKLRQILINILGNAVKFTERGHVHVRVGIGRSADETLELRFEIEDSGKGIPPERLDSIFAPFVQANPESQGGTGLGLAICERFIRMLGGSIEVESQVGIGTCFRFRIPFARTEEAERLPRGELEPMANLEPNQPSYRILNVEDNANNRLLMATILKPTGLELREAANGAEGVDIFSAWKPDLVLMDIRMPIMDGMEAIERIRALPEGKACKIVAITASTLSDERERILSAGFDDYLSKPFRHQDIQVLLERHLGLSFSKHTNTCVDAQPITKEPLSAPDALRPILEEALILGESKQIEEVLQRFEPTHPAVVKMLREWAGNYQYSRILNWLDNDSRIDSHTQHPDRR